MKKGLILIAAIMMLVQAKAQTTQRDTLNDNLLFLIEAALEQNKTLQNQKLELEKMSITQKQVYHTYIPKIEASGTYAYSKGQLNIDTDPIPFTLPGMTLPIPGIPPVALPPMDLAIPGIDHGINYSGNMWMGGLTAKWTLFTGLKAPYLGKAMKHKIKASEYMLQQSEADIIEELTLYYDKIALLVQAGKVLSDSEKRLAREADVAQRALIEGLITQHEFQKIEIARLELSSKQIELRGNRQMLQLKLQQLTGLSLVAIDSMQVELVPMQYVEAETTYLDRPEIKALDEAVIASEYKLKSESSGYLPKVQAFATHQYAGFTNGELGPAGFNEISAYPLNAVGVGFKWELFDGFHTHDERKKAKIQIQQTQNKRADAMEMLMLNFNNAYNNYQVSSAQEQLRSKQQEVAYKSLKISYKEYQHGIIKVSEFLEAQTDYEKSILEYYQTVFEQRQSAIHLMNATGELNLLSIQKLYKIGL